MRNTTYSIILFLIVTWLAPLSFAEVIPVRLSIDNVLIGDISVNLDQKGLPNSVKGDQLLQMIGSYLQSEKTKRIEEALNSQDQTITFTELQRIGIGNTYNEKELLLSLIIPLEMRSVKDFPVLVTKQKLGLDLYSKSFSGYLNISGLGTYTTRTSPINHIDLKNPAEAQLELVQNMGFFTLESRESYVEYDQDPWERVETSIVHDLEDHQMRLRLGDYTSVVQGFQSSIGAGGLQFQKQFNIYPYRSSMSKRSTTIQVKKNSLLEVFINSNLIVRTRVNAGPYNLKDLPLLYGANKVRVVLQDDYGGREEFEVDMLFDDQILAEGVHDFSYQVGLPSYFNGREKNYYKNNMSSIYHRYGVSNNLTLAFNHQNYQSENMFGLGAGFLTHHGTHFLDLASYTDSVISTASAGKWRYTSPEFSLPNLGGFKVLGGAEYRTKDFKIITSTVPTTSVFSEKFDFIVQKPITDYSSLSFGYTRTKGQNFGNSQISHSMTYQSQFAKNWRFDMTYNWNDLMVEPNQMLFTLNWIETDSKAQAALAHNTQDNLSSMRVTKTSRFNYNDFQLSMYGDRQKSTTTGEHSQNVELSANYYATKYEVRMQGIGTSSGANLGTSGLLGVGTALAWTTDSFSLSRPINDSFATIEPTGLSSKQYLSVPNGLEKDSLEISNNENFVFANLNSYVSRPLQLDSTGLGAGSSRLERESYIVHPKYRSGVYIPLKIVKSLTLKGKLASDNAEEVQYAYGKIYTADGKIFSNNFFTDESGNFVIDGLSYGKYEIELSDPRLKRISFELTDTGEAERAKEAGEKEDSEASEYEMGTIKLEKEAGR